MAGRPCTTTERASSLAPASRPVYVERIGNLWRASVEAFIECGRQLVEAKSKLEAGEWGRMVSTELPFTKTTAFRLMKVAESKPLVAHVQQLPAAWGTLYELTKLPVGALEDKLKSGEVNPKTQRQDVTRMLNAWKRQGVVVTTEPARPSSPALPPSPADLIVPTPAERGRELARQVEEFLREVDPEERAVIVSTMTEAVCPDLRRHAWEDGVVVGAQAALSALRGRKDFEAVVANVLRHVEGELWATAADRKASLMEDVSIAANAQLAPTDLFPGPDPPPTKRRTTLPEIVGHLVHVGEPRDVDPIHDEADPSVYTLNGATFTVGDTLPDGRVFLEPGPIFSRRPGVQPAAPTHGEAG